MSQSSAQYQPTISNCYEELMGDPLLLQSFSEDEWMSIHGLPHLCVIHFFSVSERLFIWLTSSALWGKAGANFITKAGRRAASIEIAPLAILVTDRVVEGNLGMITAFCRADQVEVEPLDALLTLAQSDSPKPGVVVMKVFTNSPHLLQGSFGSPYLDVTTLSDGTLTIQFPLAQLCLCRLLPYSPTQIVFPWEKEGDGLNIYPVPMETLWESSEEEHHFSPFCYCQSPSSPPIPIEM